VTAPSLWLGASSFSGAVAEISPNKVYKFGRAAWPDTWVPWSGTLEVPREGNFIDWPSSMEW